MSRSYRQPYYVAGYGSKGKAIAKRYANHMVRRTKEVIANGKAYRKIYDPWNITDYVFRYHPEPYIYWCNGEPKLHYPEPIWRVNRK